MQEPIIITERRRWSVHFINSEFGEAFLLEYHNLLLKHFVPHKCTFDKDGNVTVIEITADKV